MNLETHIIVLAGLGDGYERVNGLVKAINMPGFTFHVSTAASWKNSSEGIQPKITRVVAEVDDLSKKGRVSLVGISGSGNLAGLVYLERRQAVERVVNVCGRLRSGGIPPLWLTSIRNPAFRESVQAFEKREQELTEGDRRKFLVFQAKLDELVPGTTSYLEGARIITMPTLGHIRGIKSAFLQYGNQMVDFLRE